jgi:hypothetical protein
MAEINGVLDRIEARQQHAIDGDNALAFLQAIYRDRQIPLPVRTRAAIEALPFESPKLSATAVFPAGENFVSRLERAIVRSGAAPKLIEHRSDESLNAHEATD